MGCATALYGVLTARGVESDGDNNMGISKTTLLNETTKALAKQTEYNKEIFALKGEAGSGGTVDLNITVGNVQPDSGLWFNTYTTLYPFTYTTQTYTTQTYTTVPAAGIPSPDPAPLPDPEPTISE